LAVAVSVGVQPHQLTEPVTDVSTTADDEGLLLAAALLAGPPVALALVALLATELLAAALLAAELLAPALLAAALLPEALLVAAPLAAGDDVVLPPDPLLELQAASATASSVAAATPAVRRVDRAATRMRM
jgi:hypothetical protein